MNPIAGPLCCYIHDHSLGYFDCFGIAQNKVYNIFWPFFYKVHQQLEPSLQSLEVLQTGLPVCFSAIKWAQLCFPQFAIQDALALWPCMWPPLLWLTTPKTIGSNVHLCPLFWVLEVVWGAGLHIGCRLQWADQWQGPYAPLVQDKTCSTEKEAPQAQREMFYGSPSLQSPCSLYLLSF